MALCRQLSTMLLVPIQLLHYNVVLLQHTNPAMIQLVAKEVTCYV